MKNLILIIAMTLSSSFALADGLTLGEPVYGGNGCPAGTASTTLSPDQTALTILFDQYIAQAGAGVNLQLDRKSCNLGIPVHVPQGYSISVFQVDYRGFASVPRGAMGRFNVEYFFAGSRGPAASQFFNGPVTRDFTISQGLAAEALIWSRCGEDVILRVNSSILAKTNSRMDDVMMSIDSTDVNSRLVYHVQWKRCSL